LPKKAEPNRRPHAPRRVAPDIEVVTVTYFARDAIAQIRRLRPPELEVHIVNQRQRHREHQRTEIPERLSISLPMDPAAKKSEAEEKESEDELQSLHYLVRIAQPLPLEVQPPHAHLVGVRCTTLDFLTVLDAVDVVHQPLLGEFAESAAGFDVRFTRGRRAFIDRGEIGGS